MKSEEPRAGQAGILLTRLQMWFLLVNDESEFPGKLFSCLGAAECGRE